MSDETDRLYTKMTLALHIAEEYRGKGQAREKELRSANARLRRPRTGSDLDMTIFTDEYYRAHRSDETYHRGWAVAYAQAYRAQVMREVELEHLARPDKV